VANESLDTNGAAEAAQVDSTHPAFLHDLNFAEIQGCKDDSDWLVKLFPEGALGASCSAGAFR